jgi:hypothetical protein
VNQAALMAAGLATRPADFALFRERLAHHATPAGNDPATEPAEPLEIALDAIALGWTLKWETDAGAAR